MAFNVVGIGEVLWDLLPAGPQLGGAPANFAYHAQALGTRASVITRIGKDSLGRQILERLRQMNLPEATVQADDRFPTGTVVVALTRDGLPQFTIGDNAAWDHLAETELALQTVRGADALCFGSLAQRNAVSRATIQRLVSAAPAPSWRIFDINLRQNFYTQEVIEQSLLLSNVLKLNEEELPILARLFALRGSVRNQVEELAKAFAQKLVVLTCGASGSMIYGKDGWSEQSSQPVHVVDTVGAGDSFTAALATGLLHDLPIRDAHAIAAKVAGYVCTQAGATPRLPRTFRDQFAGYTAEN